MTIFILYLTISSGVVKHPYKFAFENTCGKVGKIMVDKYMYKNFKCIKRKIK
jgi:hypothetical protein